MGMTNEQFDSYKALLLQLLKDATRHGEEKEVVEQLVKRLEEELGKS